MTHNDTRRLEAPWIIEETPGGYRVRTANGIDVAYVYGYRGQCLAGIGWSGMTMDEARRVALGIARLPELMKPRTG